MAYSRKERFGSSVVAALTVFSAACGDAGDGGRGHVPEDKLLATLSESESIKLCEDLRARARRDEDATYGACLVRALQAAAIAETLGQTEDDPLVVCEKQLDACVVGETVGPCVAQTFAESCPATVGDLTACRDLAADGLRQLVDQTCEDGARDGGLAEPVLSPKLDACNRQLEECAVDPCCNARDSCDFADDRSCQCPDQAWDASDCEA
jgi:hypothetical protein